MRTRARFIAMAVCLAVLPVGVAAADTRVTNDTAGNYQRSDGWVDATMAACSTGRRTQNEPSVAVDPLNPLVWSPVRTTTAPRSRTGPATSGPATTGRRTAEPAGPTAWSPVTRPTSPTRGPRRRRTAACAAAGDPTQSFDGAGRLYYGFICFNRAKPTNGSIYVARYNADGASYVRTVRVERGTPSVWGVFQDKINIAVDQSVGTPTAGNVYVAWARYTGQSANNFILFSRSTDGGRTFSKPCGCPGVGPRSSSPTSAVGPDGAVYVTYREIAHQKSDAEPHPDRALDRRRPVVQRPAARSRRSTRSTPPTTVPTPAATARSRCPAG